MMCKNAFSMFRAAPMNTCAFFLLSLSAAVMVSGCQTSSASPNAVPAPAKSTSPSGSAHAALSSAPQAVKSPCDGLDGQCIGDEERNVCDADTGAVRKERCSAGTLCLSGQCVPLTVPSSIAKTKDPIALNPSQVFALAHEGWFNGWSAIVPADPKQAEAIAQDPSAWRSANELKFKPVCSPSGLVPIFDRASTPLNSPELALFAGFLISPKAQRAVLRMGFGGRMRVFLNTQLVLDETRPLTSKPFRDEVHTNLQLEGGITQVVILAERRDESASAFWFRITNQSEPLFFAALPSAACATPDLLAVSWRKEPIPNGFELQTRLRFSGLSPRAFPATPYRIELNTDKNKKNPLTLTSGEITKLNDESDGVVLQSKAKLDAANTFELAFNAGANGEFSSRTKLIYRGRLHNQITDLQSRLPTLVNAAKTPGDKASLEHHVALLQRALAENHPDRAWIAELTKDAEKIAEAMASGEDPYPSKSGIVRRAYRSELDGKLQPFTIYVPTSYKGGASDQKPLPLIVTFHGLESQPEHALRAVIGEYHDEKTDAGYAARHLPSFPNYGVFLAAPWGFGKAGQRQLGEHDVLRVVEEMKQNYRIDDLRVSITGASLGGTVAFTVPLHYPDLFSASAPLCGYPNLFNWNSVRTVPHTPWEDVLLEKRYIRNYAENGLHLPLHIVHGGLDAPERSRVIADRYRELGYHYKFDVQDDLDHNVWDYGYEEGRMIAWLRNQKRPALPLRVRLATGEYRYSSSYWVRLISMANDQSLSEIDARRLAKEHEFQVKTRNVDAFALDFSGFHLPAGERATVDGTSLPLPENAGQIFFEKASESGAFSIVPAEPSRKGKKRPGVSGPMDDVLRHPLRIVFGTQDPAQVESNRVVAEHCASYDHWAYAHFPIQPDVEITPEDRDKNSLILIGGPGSNRITAEFLAALPVQFEKDAIVFRGKRHEGKDLGISMIYPHPNNENEYIVLHAGTTEFGTLASRHLPQLVPDFLVYGAEMTVQRGDVLLDQRKVLDGGFFDQNWH